MPPTPPPTHSHQPNPSQRERSRPPPRRQQTSPPPPTPPPKAADLRCIPRLHATPPQPTDPPQLHPQRNNDQRRKQKHQLNHPNPHNPHPRQHRHPRPNRRPRQQPIPPRPQLRPELARSLPCHYAEDRSRAQPGERRGICFASLHHSYCHNSPHPPGAPSSRVLSEWVGIFDFPATRLTQPPPSQKSPPTQSAIPHKAYPVPRFSRRNSGS